MSEDISDSEIQRQLQQGVLDNADFHFEYERGENV